MENNDNNPIWQNGPTDGAVPTPPAPPSEYYYANSDAGNSGSGKLTGTLMALAIIQIIFAVWNLFSVCSGIMNIASTSSSSDYITETVFPNYKLTMMITVITSLLVTIGYGLSATCFFKMKKAAVTLSWCVFATTFIGNVVTFAVLLSNSNFEMTGTIIGVVIGSIVCGLIFIAVQVVLLTLPASRANIRNDFS